MKTYTVTVEEFLVGAESEGQACEKVKEALKSVVADELNVSAEEREEEEEEDENE